MICARRLGIGLIGRAETDGVGFGQRAIERRPGGGAGQHADLEFAAGGMLGLGAGAIAIGIAFAAPGRSEAAEADGLTVLDELGRLVRGQ